ncbi:MAG: DUF2795 domain-containing protein [Acidimicrobiia bacterium]
MTRVELVDLLSSAFGERSLGRQELVDIAVQHQARPEVLHVLRSLPGRRYLRPQDLWADLPFVPIEG